MKKRIARPWLAGLVGMALLLSVAVLAMAADKRDFKFRYGAEIGGNAAGDVVDTQSVQVLKNKGLNVETVWIDDYTDLTYWTGSTPYTTSYAGATSGQSIYQVPAANGTGKLYMVDPYAILMSVQRTTPVQTSTTGFYGYSGVTVVLPSAAADGNDDGVIGVGIAVSGATGFDHLKSGATTVYVVPYGGAGTTKYGVPNARGTKPETMMIVASTNGTVVQYGPVLSGATYWELNKPGEIAWFRLKKNSSVSAVPERRHVVN